MLEVKKNSLIENLNRYLYDRRDKAYVTARTLSVVSSISAVLLLIYLWGFEPREEYERMSIMGLNIAFTLIIIGFGIRGFYSFQRLHFILDRKFESTLMLLMLGHLFINFFISEEQLNQWLENVHFVGALQFYLIFATAYIIIYVGYRLSHLSADVSRLPLSPAMIFLLSFVTLISWGTILLMLPAMTVKEGSMPFLEALFTSVSASCVTGLIVVDTATYFTFKGQIVILFLIQFGGLGIISFASFFATFLGGKFGLRHQSMMQEMLSTETLFSAQGLLRRIVQITLMIEFVGFIMIYFSWGNVEFQSVTQKIFFSLFHSVSAFCNAGFSLFSNGLYEPGVRNLYLMHLVVLVVVIFGGIGFPAIRDLFSPKALRYRLEHPWKDWQLSTKIAVYVSAALLGIGAFFLFLLEGNQSMEGLGFVERAISSLFQSGIARTAGFNTVDIGAMALPSLMLMIFLMFIGASSGSVGGGIKTSTFFLILKAMLATIQGKQRIEVGKRQVPHELVYKAFAIFAFSVIFNFVAIILLTITEPNIDLIRLAFEQVSAFATVGLSTGITAELSDMSRVIIILSMFIGRIGPLTVMLVLSRKAKIQSYQYPTVYMMIG
jgi:trk system potassium uptake protein